MAEIRKISTLDQPVAAHPLGRSAIVPATQSEGGFLKTRQRSFAEIEALLTQRDKVVFVDAVIGDAAASGGYFNTIANALTYVATQSPSASNTWSIVVSSKEDSSNFTLVKFVSVVCANDFRTELKGAVNFSTPTFTNSRDLPVLKGFHITGTLNYDSADNASFVVGNLFSNTAVINLSNPLAGGLFALNYLDSGTTLNVSATFDIATAMLQGVTVNLNAGATLNLPNCSVGGGNAFTGQGTLNFHETSSYDTETNTITASGAALIVNIQSGSLRNTDFAGPSLTLNLDLAFTNNIELTATFNGTVNYLQSIRKNWVIDGGATVTENDLNEAAEAAQVDEGIAKILTDLGNTFPLLLKTGAISKGSGNSLNIAAHTGFAEKETSTDRIRIELPAQTDLAIPGAVLDSSTVNYVKLKALDAAPFYEVTVDDTAPTTKEVLLETFTGADGGPYTFSGTTSPASLKLTNKIESLVRFEGFAARGSTDTAILQFTSRDINKNPYNYWSDNHDSYGTAGLEITINAAGWYRGKAVVPTKTGGGVVGISLNASTLNVAISSLAAAEVLDYQNDANGGVHKSVDFERYLKVGDIVRVQTEPSDPTGITFCFFEFSRLLR